MSTGSGFLTRVDEGLGDASDKTWQARRWVREKARGWSPAAKVAGAILIALLVAPPLYHLLWRVAPLPEWGNTESFCSRHKLGCDLTTHLVADAILAAAVYALFLSRQSRSSTAWRRRAKREPHTLFTWVRPLEGGLTEIAAESVSDSSFRFLPARIRPLARRVRIPNAIRERWPGKSSPLVESILGRNDLVKEIADDLETTCDAQVIVGDSAAGKTMVLIKLADCLARRRKVPIPISVQDQSKLNFEDLAFAAYKSSSVGVAEETLNKQWAELRRRGQVVVLVDDLEKAGGRTGPNPHQVEAALQAASRAKLRVVAASRPYGLPADFSHGRIDLEELRSRDVEEDLVRVIQRASDADDEPDPATTGEMVKHLADRAEINLTLYYLSLARVLARLGLLRSPPERVDARLWLLRTYRRALANGKIREDAGLRPTQRKIVLKDLEAIAFARVLGARQEDTIAAKLTELGLPSIKVRSVVSSARRLGVLNGSHGVRFAHPTTMAFFASCFLRDPRRSREAWKLLLDEHWAPIRALTLVFATVESRDPEQTQTVCRTLLSRAAWDVSETDGSIRAGSTWVAAAAEIARHAKSINRATAADVVRGIELELRAAKPLGREQIPLLKALGALCGKSNQRDAYELLWAYSMTMRDYWFSRQATKELIGARSALEVLLPLIEDVMDSARRYERNLVEPAAEDHKREPFASLRAVAWVLPSFRSVLYEQLRDVNGTARDRLEAQKDQLEGYQSELIRFADSLTKQRGLEAAVAQGIKFDAVRDDSLAPDPFAIAMLDGGSPKPQFWFSRLLLVQAVARRARRDPTGDAEAVVRKALKDSHIFVHHTAKLGLRALDSDQPERFLFDDLTEVVRGAPYGLARETSQLIGDVVLALNLNEYGNSQSRIAFGQLDHAPACLTKSRRRKEILLTNQKPLDCPFAKYQRRGACLCPYTHEHPDAEAMRREITRAFCRYQRINAGRVPWNRMRGKHARKFWEQMEELAQY